MLNPALCIQSKERESESKFPWRQDSCSVMVSVLDLSLEGWRCESRQRAFWASNRVCQFVNIGSSPSMCGKNMFFCKARFHPIRPQGVTPPTKMNRKGELQTSRISSNSRIWQLPSRVPQIVKVLCVWYSWKYVARLGLKPLKFLYSEFLSILNL